MTGGMTGVARVLSLVLFGLVLIGTVVPVVMGEVGDDGRLTTSDGDTVDITDKARKAGFTFAPDVAPADQQWILRAVARARPEAARLIAEVDGLVVIGTYSGEGTTVGITRSHQRGFTVDLNIAYLNGEAALDRTTVVLHELGHVVDFALVPAATNEQLDALIPRGGPCGAGGRLRRHGGALRRHVRQVGAQRRRLGGGLRLRHPDAGVARGLGQPARPARLHAASLSVAATAPSAVIQRIGPSASTAASPAPAAARCSISASMRPVGSPAISSSSSAAQ